MLVLLDPIVVAKLHKACLDLPVGLNFVEFTLELVNSDFFRGKL